MDCSMIIVPSSALDSMNLGSIGGLTAFDQNRSNKDDDKSDS